jgi:hypothetical protein
VSSKVCCLEEVSYLSYITAYLYKHAVETQENPIKKPFRHSKYVGLGMLVLNALI